MNDARNVRRSQKMSYATIRSWCTVSATIKTCSLPNLGGWSGGAAARPVTPISSNSGTTHAGRARSGGRRQRIRRLGLLEFIEALQRNVMTGPSAAATRHDLPHVWRMGLSKI